MICYQFLKLLILSIIAITPELIIPVTEITPPTIAKILTTKTYDGSYFKL